MESTPKSESFDSNVENMEDEGNTVTMLDVLEEQQKWETQAYAVLGASDDKNCSYNKGYVKRQALFSCKTCIENEDKPACICLACSYHCHEGHDLIELYTKRNFRCDCGNSLFKGKKCSLEPNKELNELNSYNHNFRGIYCTCERPYPDLEESVADEMLQCIICEDWYHSRHLGGFPTENNFCEVICASCTDRLDFLRYYSGYSMEKTTEETNDSSTVNKDVEETNDSSTVNKNVEETNDSSTVNKDVEETNDSSMVDVESPIADIVEPAAAAVIEEITKPASTSSSKEKQNGENSKEPEKTEECLLKTMKPVDMPAKEASYWTVGFRKSLCVCQSCQKMYKDLNVSFLTDLSDSVGVYEEEGLKERIKKVPSTNEETTMKALSTLNRVTQIEAIQRYNELQSNLKEYLLKFAENKKVVREEDIHEFFEQMTRKKQKVEEVPYFCH